VIRIAHRNIAIAHEWFASYAGSERVVEQMLAVYPQADLFSLVDFLEPGQRSFIQDKPVQTSFIQNLPFARRAFRQYLPLMPLAVEQFDLTAYDLVISSNHAVTKGVITGPNQLHICMCYSPCAMLGFAAPVSAGVWGGTGAQGGCGAVDAAPVAPMGLPHR
jgi:hypothetical protein